jgi:glycerophosphoryl diester phosphodiesterase
MKRAVPLITAHTGCEGSPVNTVASMLQGIRSGADAVEIDIRSTGDGTVILMHDGFIRTRAGELALNSLTLRELLELEKKGRILSNHPQMRITRLEEAMEAAGSMPVIMNLDLKDDRSIEGLCRAARKYDLLDRTIVSGCDGTRAARVKERCPELQVLLNVTTGGAGPEYERTVEEICRQAVSSCCCGINIDFSLCSEQLVGHARLRYLPVSVWTVDREEDMRSLIAMGVHSITTCRPRSLRRIMSERPPDRQGH